MAEPSDRVTKESREDLYEFVVGVAILLLLIVAVIGSILEQSIGFVVVFGLMLLVWSILTLPHLWRLALKRRHHA